MIRRWFRRRRHGQVLRADAHAARLLIGPLMSKVRGYVPWTGYSLRPFALATLLNDLVVNHRAAYLELGAGVSTIFVAKVAELNGLALDVVSVEHDAAWIETLRAILSREGLTARVRFVHAPLVDRVEPAPFGMLRWYEEAPLLEALRGRPRDLVLVDGPPAGNGSLNRYPALPFLRAHDLLADDASVFLDDAHRPAERAIARSWSERYRMEFQLLHGRVAYCVGAGHFAALVD